MIKNAHFVFPFSWLLKKIMTPKSKNSKSRDFRVITTLAAATSLFPVRKTLKIVFNDHFLYKSSAFPPSLLRKEILYPLQRGIKTSVTLLL